jgi:hypothetical protein
MPSFEHIYNNALNALKIRPPPERLVSLDPGATTGVAVFRRLSLHMAAQLNTSMPDVALEQLTLFFDQQRPTEVVLEDYRVYANRVEQHAGSSLQTPRLIGMIETLCMQRKIPFHKQPAGTAKYFCTDDKLREWGMYATGQRHARDAVRHAAYYILFPPKTRTSENIVKIAVPNKTLRGGGRHVG